MTVDECDPNTGKHSRNFGCYLIHLRDRYRLCKVFVDHHALDLFFRALSSDFGPISMRNSVAVMLASDIRVKVFRALIKTDLIRFGCPVIHTKMRPIIYSIDNLEPAKRFFLPNASQLFRRRVLTNKNKTLEYRCCSSGRLSHVFVFRNQSSVLTNYGDKIQQNIPAAKTSPIDRYRAARTFLFRPFVHQLRSAERPKGLQRPCSRHSQHGVPFVHRDLRDFHTAAVPFGLWNFDLSRGKAKCPGLRVREELVLRFSACDWDFSIRFPAVSYPEFQVWPNTGIEHDARRGKCGPGVCDSFEGVSDRLGAHLLFPRRDRDRVAPRVRILLVCRRLGNRDRRESSEHFAQGVSWPGGLSFADRHQRGYCVRPAVRAFAEGIMRGTEADNTDASEESLVIGYGKRSKNCDRRRRACGPCCGDEDRRSGTRGRSDLGRSGKAIALGLRSGRHQRRCEYEGRGRFAG